MEEYLSVVIAAAVRKPFLKGLTLQYLMKVMSTHSAKNYISVPPFEFKLRLGDFLGELLRVRVDEKKMVGFHLLLTRAMLKQMTEDHVKIDY